MAPGCRYDDFNMMDTQPIKRTLYPTVTGSSAIAIKYDKGVLVVADTLASYGKMARYKNVCRLKSVGPRTVVAASGEFSDFQYLSTLLDESDAIDSMSEDSCRRTCREWASYLSRVLYNRRSRFNPLWNSLLVVGVDDSGKQEISYVDLYGTSYTADYAATGFAAYLAAPILKEGYKPDLTEEAARDLLDRCLHVCYYRDTSSYPKVQFATVSLDGINIDQPKTLTAQRWSFAGYMAPTLSLGLAGNSW
eukprot:GHVU01155825.1.p1 GENE.GHVU01155825.1~~GHVU01155825.1.p1  ORF type:complete len:249 (+),score=51.80 GHVU01155825.1:2089-2835(+)